MSVHLTDPVARSIQTQAFSAGVEQPQQREALTGRSTLSSLRQNANADGSFSLCSCFENLINWVRDFFSNIFGSSSTPAPQESTEGQQRHYWVNPYVRWIAPGPDRQRLVADATAKLEGLGVLINRGSSVDQVREYFRTQVSVVDQNEIKSRMTMHGADVTIAEGDLQTRLDWAESVINGQVPAHADILAEGSLFRNCLGAVLTSLSLDINPNEAYTPSYATLFSEEEQVHEEEQGPQTMQRRFIFEPLVRWISPGTNRQHQIADSITKLQGLKSLITSGSSVDQVRQYFRTQLSVPDQNEIKSRMTLFGAVTGIALSGNLQTRLDWAERIIAGQVQIAGETAPQSDIEHHVNILASRSLFRNSVDRVLQSLESDQNPNEIYTPSYANLQSYRDSPHYDPRLRHDHS